jgi:hypothetical protein
MVQIVSDGMGWYGAPASYDIGSHVCGLQPQQVLGFNSIHRVKIYANPRATVPHVKGQRTVRLD